MFNDEKKFKKKKTSTIENKKPKMFVSITFFLYKSLYFMENGKKKG